jgi:hypothetical protein
MLCNAIHNSTKRAICNLRNIKYAVLTCLPQGVIGTTNLVALHSGGIDDSCDVQGIVKEECIHCSGSKFDALSSKVEDVFNYYVLARNNRNKFVGDCGVQLQSMEVCIPLQCGPYFA